MDTFYETLLRWQPFFTTIAAVSATLAGLLFVSLSINRKRITAVENHILLRLAHRVGILSFYLGLAFLPACQCWCANDHPTSQPNHNTIKSSTNALLKITTVENYESSSPRVNEDNFLAEEFFLSTTNHEKYELIIVKDEKNRKFTILPASFDFYILNKGEITAFKMGLGGVLFWCEAYIQLDLSSGDFDQPITDLNSEAKIGMLLEKIKGTKRLLLRNAAPAKFFTANSSGGSQPGLATIKGISFKSGVMCLDLLSPGGKSDGKFWIDLNKKTIIKSVVDGQEMDFSGDMPFAVPLIKH